MIRATMKRAGASVLAGSPDIDAEDLAMKIYKASPTPLLAASPSYPSSAEPRAWVREIQSSDIERLTGITRVMRGARRQEASRPH
jgi:hypothetical protein